MAISENNTMTLQGAEITYLVFILAFGRRDNECISLMVARVSVWHGVHRTRSENKETEREGLPWSILRREKREERRWFWPVMGGCGWLCTERGCAYCV
uniref:Uncharacterized protein n=1 Tax=Cannabis sativa TaxID=3483 RepID=A0A803PTB9_CANSA